MSEIKDGIYAYVSGTVGDKLNSGDGGTSFRLATKIHPQSRYPDQITVWDATDDKGQPADVQSGDRVTVRGWFSWSRSESKEGKAYTNYALRVSRVTKHESEPERQMRPWTGVVPVVNHNQGEEVPF